MCAISLLSTEWIDDHPILLSQKIWMDGVTGGITPAKFSKFFDNARGLSLLKNLARGRRLRIFPVVHQSIPKENVRQLVYTKKADIWCHIGLPKYDEGTKPFVLWMTDGC